MRSTEIAQAANRAAEMLQDDKTLSEVTEQIRSDVLRDDDGDDIEVVDQKVRHILRVAFDKLKRDYRD